ncbi:hypothetical protein [Novosphingobium sp. ERN07]|nr:hypothetical protein [Novosphingobium sp. ERN07]
MAHQLHHIARLAAFALSLAAALHFAERLIAGFVQCQAWETCPW